MPNASAKRTSLTQAGLEVLPAVPSRSVAACMRARTNRWRAVSDQAATWFKTASWVFRDWLGDWSNKGPWKALRSTTACFLSFCEPFPWETKDAMVA